MGEILGIGLSHYPPFSGRDDDMAGVLHWTLDDPDIPADAKDPANWPEKMRAEWSDDGGRKAAGLHREALGAGFKRARAAIDAFQPDVLVIWGDDQYENFREDIVPPYAVLCYDDMTIAPWSQAGASSNMRGKPNVWGEPADTSFVVKGRPDIGKALVADLLQNGVDTGYAYSPLHHSGLPHAFLNAVLYLDYERNGFPYPVLPFPINCYGRRLIGYRGLMSRFGEQKELDPPSPTPARMVEVGRATARFFRDSPWRVALVASSSWSHAFICDKTWRLRPDTASDRALYEALRSGDTKTWEGVSLEALEDAGQQELLNWFPLIGAMDELGLPLTWSEFNETSIFNSNKVFAVYGGTG